MLRLGQGQPLLLLLVLMVMMLGLLCRWVLRWRRLLLLWWLLVLLPLQGLHSCCLLLPLFLGQAPATAAPCCCRCFGHCRSRMLPSLLPGFMPRLVGRWVLPPVPLLLLLVTMCRGPVHCRRRLLLLLLLWWLLGAVPGRRRRNLLHWHGLSCHPAA